MPDLCGVYIIESKGLWKIGMTTSFRKRWSSYKTQNPHMGKVLFVESRIPPILEARLHRKYRQYRTRGEWFKLPNECVADLRKKWNAKLLADLDVERHKRNLRELSLQIDITKELWQKANKQAEEARERSNTAFKNHMASYDRHSEYIRSLFRQYDHRPTN